MQRNIKNNDVIKQGVWLLVDCLVERVGPLDYGWSIDVDVNHSEEEGFKSGSASIICHIRLNCVREIARSVGDYGGLGEIMRGLPLEVVEHPGCRDALRSPFSNGVLPFILNIAGVVLGDPG
ncbi:hypothetical protein Tco_1381693 [Tanacetum coccineum]